ncbi:Chromosome segregation SMC protein, putative [Oleispira antarctica RB-8]|uniref:Chromosome partition protein Smc n=1 Tax=Oleispira antarctica RB-8 TaxID=698738 RepID=R4YSX8_OLEAN|nr:Chromosome segregation SMC protein, putative [Oleispira antarctica RB-8]
MRLKAIKLAGFKSFVDPTYIPFPTNMTGILGPNGCGKSNTIDAVRWVMGESSAKNLRGESMTDVIFNGSAQRKPVGKASVDLIFDNSDGTLRGEYAAFSEVALRRQVTREGQSTYYLNGTKCRRKDITDIFLGTGLGARSYSIIEQGMISRLIESKPEELRVFIEEAAGISKYKERRRETENRMRRTNENLERLQDIRDEMERQLAHLHRQAQAAEKYKEYKFEERLKKGQLQALKWKVLDVDYRKRELEISELDMQFEAKMAQQTSADTAIEERRESHHERTEVFNKAQGKYYEVGSQIARQEQKLEHQAQMSLQLSQDLAETEKGILETQRALEEDQLKLEDVNEELMMLEPELEVLVAGEEEAGEELILAEESMQAWQRSWDEFTQKASAPARQAEVAQSRIQNLEQQLTRLQQRIERLDEEKRQLISNPEAEEILFLQEQISEHEMQLEEQQESGDSFGEQINVQREGIEGLRRKLDEGRSELQQVQGRKASLEALQQAAKGEGNTAVSHWLESHQLSRKARLSEKIHVESGWEKAVEMVMGNYLQAVIIDDLDPVQHWVDGLKDGEIILWSGTVGNTPAAGSHLLSAKVSGDENVSSLLAHVQIADDLAQAMSRRQQLAEDESIITPEGLWLGKSWLRVAKDGEGNGGILARQQELEELEIRFEDLDISVEEWEVDLDAEQLKLRNIEQQREVQQKEMAAFARQLAEYQSQLSGKQARAEQLALRTDKINNELAEVNELQTLEREQIAEARIQWQEAMENMDQDADERSRLQTERENTTTRIESARIRARQEKDQAHQLQLRHQGFSSQQQSLSQAVERLHQQMQRNQERKSSIQQNQNRDHDSDLEELKMQLEELLEKRLDAEQIMSDARRELEAVDAELRQFEKDRGIAEKAGLDLRTQLEQVRMETQSLEIRRNSLVEQLVEDELTLEGVLESLPHDADIQLWSEELERIAERIRRLGAINLAAIDEYKIQSERKVYLDAQHEDLEKALATLENAIHKIDRETKARFKETFDKVNSGLAELFPKVFGGGHASLELVGDDLLNAGVAIMASPPGKKNSTIHLLSGGEKALTAIALVFSIFQLNPAPFCMLDEVDAPLDDANVGRYARLVKAMSEKVQFIYITHNKIAMEKADQLMGVTMHEPGVSRLVSVDIEEAVKMVEA